MHVAQNETIIDDVLPSGVRPARRSTRVRAHLAERSLLDYGHEGLAALLDVDGVEADESPLFQAFESMTAPWSTQLLGERPRFPSDASNDHTPYEYSVAFGAGAPEIRFMVEAHGEGFDLPSRQRAGQALTRRLAREYGVQLDRFERVEALFFPAQPEGVFAAWHAVCGRPGAPLEFKLYLNLQCQGRAAAPRLLEEAMTRLGMSRAFHAAYGAGAGRLRPSDELVYFSLDLSARKEARVKVYCRHRAVSAAQLEVIAARARNHRPGDATLLCRTMTGKSGPFLEKPVITCFSFVEGDVGPSAVTLHFPVSAYASDDLVASERIGAFLSASGLSTFAYDEAVRRFTTRPLDAGSGLQSYCSFRREKGEPRVTVYFGPEAYRVAPPRREKESST